MSCIDVEIESIPFNICYENNIITNTITQKNFRNLLWIAILKHFRFGIIEKFT